MTVSPMASATTSRPNLRPEPMIQSIDDDLLAGRTATSAKRAGIEGSSAHGLVPPRPRLNPWFDAPPPPAPAAPAPRAHLPEPRRDQLFTLASISQSGRLRLASELPSREAERWRLKPRGCAPSPSRSGRRECYESGAVH